jgi:DNA-binding transcriptional MerR regulator
MSETPNDFSENLLSVSEVADKLEINKYVLEFWITEFEEFGFEGNELFSEKEFRLASLIKRLIYEECFTLKGVKRRLSGYDLNSLTESIRENDDLSEEENSNEAEKSEKNAKWLQFSLDCQKNMDIIASDVDDILALIEPEL